MGSITHPGDAVKWARDYSGPLFHALFCDAPYEMAFMGKDWDGSGVAFDPETWEAFARVLYPGAFLFVFAGTINDDLISVAMREAGLRKFHKMMGWAYGSGFPKASRVNHGSPKTEDFAGHRYGLQALKPAIETILIFQKPYEGKPLDNITQTGAGVLNIDGGRIVSSGSDVNDRADKGAGNRKEDSIFGASGMGEWKSEAGRWPSNFLLLDEAAARALDEQSGERPVSGSAKNGKPAVGEYPVGMFGIGDKQGPLYNDSGGASRFFFQVSEQIDEADPVFYSAKASRGERDAGLEGFELVAAGIGDERPSGQSYERLDGRKPLKARNPHPTVKPLSLTRYLATLLLPPIEYAPRRLFVPFAGVGSEQIGGAMAGWEEIEGVELTEEYIPINRARIKYWSRKNIGAKKPKSKIPENVKNPNQMELI